MLTRIATTKRSAAGRPRRSGIAADNYSDAVTETSAVDHHGASRPRPVTQYTARNYPQAYWNRTAFVCEPTGHLVATFVLEPHGAGFRSRNAWNLVASDDEWAAPVMAEVGPDGNVWVLDWYNYIIQHNPTPVGFQTGKGNAYETELRDKRHGRVFRVVPKGWKEEKSRSLAGAVPDAYVEMLRNKNVLGAEAQRLLVERDKLMFSALRESPVCRRSPRRLMRSDCTHLRFIRLDNAWIGCDGDAE
jgi:hypothetical protein